jgi:hypothetical protein
MSTIFLTTEPMRAGGVHSLHNRTGAAAIPALSLHNRTAAAVT